jgi:hypothetical protein
MQGAGTAGLRSSYLNRSRLGRGFPCVPALGEATSLVECGTKCAAGDVSQLEGLAASLRPHFRAEMIGSTSATAVRGSPLHSLSWVPAYKCPKARGSSVRAAWNGGGV